MLGTRTQKHSKTNDISLIKEVSIKEKKKGKDCVKHLIHGKQYSLIKLKIPETGENDRRGRDS